jgi:predicted Rossmann fold flavoprotein
VRGGLIESVADKTHQFDVLILGAGAAGLMCAIEAGRRGRRVVVLERAERIGKKILISGGGRCNFTNLGCAGENFISANQNFAKSALARYTPADFIDLVEKHHIPYHEKTLGQLFCDGSSREIVLMLQQECDAAGVRISLNCAILDVSHDDEFIVRTQREEFRAPALVVATGGLSISKMGATAFGYDLARQFGLSIQETRPALVPLVFDSQYRQDYCDLAGVSAEVVASFKNQRFREKMLVTHRGLSGPAILQISSYWKPPQAISIDLAPGVDVTAELRTQSARKLAMAKSKLHEILPSRLADRWLELHGPSEWTNAALLQLERNVHNWSITPAGSEGYDKAEVTAGGVDTSELNSKTMQSRRVPDLFFVGEVVDVTGQLGGYNFQWAWSSGAVAGWAV